MNKTIDAQSIRWQLLTTVSTAALLISVCGAVADETDRPVLWIDAGGQLEKPETSQQAFAPPFVTVLDANPFTPPSVVQKPPGYALGEEAKISFDPEGTNWNFSVAVRYGRSNGANKHIHQETQPSSPVKLESAPAFSFYIKGPVAPNARRFSDLLAHNSEKHDIIDFQAGKDIGLGMFGARGSSTLSAGIRFAQFTSRSIASINADPDFGFHIKYATTAFHYFQGKFIVPQQRWHLYAAQSDLTHSFRGTGPSLAWDASVPMIGAPEAGEVTLDWGINGAVLFGRQRVRGHHKTVAQYNSVYHFSRTLPIVYNHVYAVDRARTVTVPNLGGFAALSFNYIDAKISLGYRADFFFGAIDGGIDARQSVDRNFFGPYASISVGVGD